MPQVLSRLVHHVDDDPWQVLLSDLESWHVRSVGEVIRHRPAQPGPIAESRAGARSSIAESRGQHRGHGDVEASPSTLWQQLGTTIAAEHREPILTAPEQAGGRTVAKRRLPELADVVGPDEAVRQAIDDWPEAVLWPMGFLVDRLRRRLAETHGAGLEAVAAESLGRQADRRWRAGMLVGAANLGRTWGAAGVDAEDAESWIRAEFGDDDEAAAQALQAYTAACHGEELW